MILQTRNTDEAYQAVLRALRSAPASKPDHRKAVRELVNATVLVRFPSSGCVTTGSERWNSRFATWREKVEESHCTGMIDAYNALRSNRTEREAAIRITGGHGVFRVFGGALSLTVVEYSSNVLTEFPYELPWYCALLYRMRAALRKHFDVSVGTYTHFAHSLYLFDKEAGEAERMIHDLRVGTSGVKDAASAWETSVQS